MLILTIKTDQPMAELGLFNNKEKLTDYSWEAHRQLAETIHQKIDNLLRQQKTSLADGKLDGLVCFKGPGSFTGLRIGFTVANSLAYSYQIPIVSSGDKSWQQTGIDRLLKGENETVSLPDYGQEAHITSPRK